MDVIWDVINECIWHGVTGTRDLHICFNLFFYYQSTQPSRRKRIGMGIAEGNDCPAQSYSSRCYCQVRNWNRPLHITYKLQT